MRSQVGITVTGRRNIVEGILERLKVYNSACLSILRRHIPGEPAILPVNMPGAGSMVLANFGTREIALAIEQGELQGRVWDMDGLLAGRPNWLRDLLINILDPCAARAQEDARSVARCSAHQ